MSAINRSIKIVAAIFAVCCSLNVSSQDIHFSQFYASPLTLNPAMTGNLNGNYRLTAIYRNQYATIPAPYNTFAISADMSILRNSLGGDHAGVGFSAYNDVAGDGNLSNTSVFVSAAYHKGLDRFKRHNISVGIQGGFTQKSLQFDQLYFGNQLTDNGFDPLLPNGEPVQDQSFGYFDVNLGAMYTGRLVEGISGYGGVSFHHFSQPKESFLGTDNRLGSRLVLHGGGEAFINNSFSVSPSAIYMKQTGATELTIGSAVSYHFLNGNQNDKRTSLFTGIWYRIPHEIIFVGGIDFKDLRFGISYDLTVSPGLRDANAYQGGFEISFAYIGTLFETRRKAPLMYCPRF